MLAIYQKELKSYFNNLFGYLYISIVLLFMGIFATQANFKGLLADISSPLGPLSLVMFLITPILTMKSIAEEKQKKTDQLLYSLPVSVTSTVLAKYFAMLTVFLIPMAVICVYPFVLSSFGLINFARAFGSIFAFTLMGACLLAIGLFVSALTENQIVSAIVSFVTMLAIYCSTMLVNMLPATPQGSFVAFTVCAVALGIIVYFMIKNYVIAMAVSTLCEVILAFFFRNYQAAFEGLFGKFVNWISLYDRFIPFYNNGIFDLTAIVYFLSVIFVFVFLSIQAVEKRRWS